MSDAEDEVRLKSEQGATRGPCRRGGRSLCRVKQSRVEPGKGAGRAGFVACEHPEKIRGDVIKPPPGAGSAWQMEGSGPDGMDVPVCFHGSY